MGRGARITALYNSRNSDSFNLYIKNFYPFSLTASLANNGVLFLDEMPEFTKKTLDMLRQPLETGNVTISRAQGTVTYPAQFILFGAMNPCPCGNLGSTTNYCTCTQKQITAYQNRISGPILDRIDITLSITPVALHSTSKEPIETSEQIIERVKEARDRQLERYQEHTTNSTVSSDILLKHVILTSTQKQFLQHRSQQLLWSNRVQLKIIRLARTIADLRGEESVSDEALWEAATLRQTPTKQHHIQKRVQRST